MFSSKDGKMIILSSPSGAGKTTLAKKISKQKNYKISISHTTRQPRQNEVDGVDYFFISQETFKKLIQNDSFLEYAKVFNNLYGSTKEQVFKNLERGYNVLFDIDWQGAEQIRKKNSNYYLVSIFILGKIFSNSDLIVKEPKKIVSYSPLVLSKLSVKI